MSGAASRPRPDRVRLGILGLGAVAQAVHLPLLARLRDAFEIHAVADVSAGLVETLGEQYRVPVERRATSLDALLDVAAWTPLVILTSGSHGRRHRGADSTRAGGLRREAPGVHPRRGGRDRRPAGSRCRSSPAGRLHEALRTRPWSMPRRWRSSDASGRPGDRGHGPPPDAEAQLAFARLLPPPSDIPAAILDGSGRRPMRSPDRPRRRGRGGLRAAVLEHRPGQHRPRARPWSGPSPATPSPSTAGHVAGRRVGRPRSS